MCIQRSGEDGFVSACRSLAGIGRRGPQQGESAGRRNGTARGESFTAYGTVDWYSKVRAEAALALALPLVPLPPQELSLLVLPHLFSAPFNDATHRRLPLKGREKYLFPSQESSQVSAVPRGRQAAR